MLQDVVVLKADGTLELEKQELPALEELTSESCAPTIEDRLSALESAMLAMMGVDSNV